MKKLCIYFFLVLFSLQTPSWADNLSEYEIEGISLGDSLLDHLSKEEIITEIEHNKPTYNYLTDEFGEVYLPGKYKDYDNLSVFVKPKDKNYLIYYIGGTVYYDDNIKQCYAKQKEIIKEFSSQFKFIRKEEKTFAFPWDPTGKSTTRYVSLFLDSGDEVSVACSEYEKSLKIKNNWADSLVIEVLKKEQSDWMRNHIN